MPKRILLAIMGGLLALVALALPWLSSSSPALPDFLGYEDSVFWVGARVVAAVGSVVLALRLFEVPQLRETQRAVFAGSAGIFAMRPLYWLLTNPDASDFKSVGVSIAQVYTPAYGLWLSFAAAACMLVAAVLTHLSDEERVAAERELARLALLEDPEMAAFAGPAPSAEPPVREAAAPPTDVATAPAAEDPVEAPELTHPAVPAPPSVPAIPETPSIPRPTVVPAAFAPASPMPDPPRHHPAPRSTPLEPAAHLAMPVIRDDAGAYGPDGPSRLGESANLVKLHDPYAPKGAAPAPHVAALPPRQQPAPEAQPAPSTAPIASPGALASDATAPDPVAAPAPPRQRSVAPPGFG